VILLPLGTADGVGPDSVVRPTGRPFSIRCGPSLLGRVIDGLGDPIDGQGPLADDAQLAWWPVERAAPDPLKRRRVTEPLPLGVRAIDALATVGDGQRIGLFAGPGLGKSTLLGQIARHSEADVIVIGLVGERGREVREFIDRSLGSALSRSVVVVATSDQPALLRIKAAFTATTIAEWFRDQGRHVTLMMDSVTRFAMAQREVGLAIGEPPATRGYTPSVFALLPKLLERSGTSPSGSITGLYTVLVDGDDMNEPVADAVRAILDGHVVLSRDLAHAGHYPAIDVLGSVSRLIDQIVPADIRMAGQELRKLMAALREKEDLISIGAYAAGTDPVVDTALAKRGEIAAFLQQAVEHCSSAEEADAALLELVLGGEPEELLAADLAEDDAAGALPVVAPGASAIPPLHLSV
jgi:flagellum-specific ATP synthase